MGVPSEINVFRIVPRRTVRHTHGTSYGTHSHHGVHQAIHHGWDTMPSSCSISYGAPWGMGKHHEGAP